MADFRNLLSQAKHVVSEEGGVAAQRIALVLLCLAMFVPTMFRGFIDPDETRYAEVAREMLENGDWVVPHLNYVPYFMKPPLMHWILAAPASWLGFHHWVLRIGPVLAAIFGVLITYEMGRALGSRRTGLVAGAILATAIGYFMVAVSLTTDMVFSVFLFGAWWAFWRHYQSGGMTQDWIALAWLLGSLACFTKGPLGPALLVFTVLVFVAIRGEWWLLLRLRPAIGMLIFILINVPWMILIYKRDPRFLQFFYVQVNMAGLRDASLQHSEPFFYYFYVLPGMLFPWTLPMVAAIYLAVRQLWREGRKTASVESLWLVSMFLGGFVLLSIPAAKLGTYCLPLFSAAALLTANLLRSVDGRSRVCRILVPVQCSVALIGLVALIVVTAEGRFRVGLQNINIPLALLVIAVWTGGLALATVAGLRGSFRTSMLAMGATAAIAFPIVMLYAPTVVTWRTAEELCERSAQHLRSADVIAVNDEKQFSVPLTVRRRVAIMGHAGEQGMGLFTEIHPDRPLPANPFRLKADDLSSSYLLNTDKLANLWRSHRSVYLLSSERGVADLQHRMPDVWITEDLTTHPRTAWILDTNGETLLISNRAPAVPSAGTPNNRK